jgi:hypothetical protein
VGNCVSKIKFLIFKIRRFLIVSKGMPDAACYQATERSVLRLVLFSVRLRLVELLHSGTAKLEAGSAGSFSNGQAEIAWL